MGKLLKNYKSASILSLNGVNSKRNSFLVTKMDQKIQWLLLFSRSMIRILLVSCSQKYRRLGYSYLVSFIQEAISTRLHAIYTFNEK